MAPRRLAVVLLLGALAAASLLLAASTTVNAAAAPGRIVIASPADTVLPRTAFVVDGSSSTTHVIFDSSARRRRLDLTRSAIPADDSSDSDAAVPARDALEAADTILLLLLPRTPPVATNATPGTGSAPHRVGPGHLVIRRAAGDDDAKACGAFLRQLGEVFLSGFFFGGFCNWLRYRYVKAAEARRVVKATAAAAA